MPGLSQTLSRIARERKADPLAPVTVVVPSHLAGIQLRRRLGAMGAFAGVRFETLPRLAEIVGAGEMASKGRSPLARPIGDYLAAAAARESRREFKEVRELAGFGRVLRQMFRRLRRGGISSPDQVTVPLSNGYLGELIRLYGDFRSRTAAFYDEEDLLEVAAGLVNERRAAAVADFGSICVVPPGALSAGADAFLRALRRSAPRFTTVDEPVPSAEDAFVLAPDPAGEVREVAREVLSRLENGLGLHEIAVFHGADRAYSRLLREAFASAGLPAATMPGIPLSETISGRAVLLLASLPAEDYSRTAVMDFFAIAPLRARIPGDPGEVVPQTSRWDAMSREAGVTRGAGRWRSGLAARRADVEAGLDDHDDDNAARRRSLEYQLALTSGLQGAIEALIARLEPLRQSLPAREFIERFGKTVDEYLRPDAEALDAVKGEIEQLGTVGAVGGSFSLPEFVQALRANLEIATLRERGIGDGVLVADYRLAAGLEFRHVVVCGAFEGSFPAGPGSDTLVDDGDWAWLRAKFPYVEDAAMRVQRAAEAAARAVAAAGAGHLTWTAPLYEPGGTREYYPSPLMVEAARRRDAAIQTASDLRRATASSLLRRSPSPMAAGLRGPAVDRSEVALRGVVSDLQAGVLAGPGHRLYPQVRLLRSRRGAAFSEFDGNLAALAASGRLPASRSASPTALEAYAACGFRYFSNRVLYLNVVEEPEDRDVMDPTDRGSLMHGVLDAFFKEKQAEGRPLALESWGAADLLRLRAIAEDHLEEAGKRGKTGLDIFADHDARTILADLEAFLDADNAFRLETGAVPWQFEAPIPPVEIAGITMRGIVDRIDRTPDGRRAWVIDYKTGSLKSFERLEKGSDGPLAGGTKLQLPAYVAAAADSDEVAALYWFISRQGEFRQINFQPTAANMAIFEAAVAAVLAGIAGGAFPAVPGEEDEFYNTFENCRYCDFTRICSSRRDHDFHHKAGDAAMKPWWDVGAAARGGQ